MQTATIPAADYNALKELKTFENKQQINETVRAFLYQHKHELTPTAVNLLKIISRFAVKIPGVCWTKIGTLADLAGKTSRTIHRALNQLEELGIIERRKTIRKNGGYGHPIIIILPQDVTSDVISDLSHRQEPTKADTSTVEQPKNKPETKIYKTKSLRVNKNNNNDIRIDEIPIDETFVNKKVPKEFVKIAKNGFTALEIEDLWKRVEIASRKTKYFLMNETEVAIEALKETIKTYKRRRIRKTLGGYFYKTTVALMKENIEEYEAELAAEKRRQAVKEGKIPSWLTFNWLEADLT
ncbi:helix-turn-helix domain protein [Phage Altai3]|nr:helix-turn-helix domain protein [Phage Altai3]